MCAELPPPYRLVVKRDGEENGQKSQGTAWFVARSKVITAWHVSSDVIGDSGALSGVRFEIEIEGTPINLEYVPDRRIETPTSLCSMSRRRIDFESKRPWCSPCRIANRKCTRSGPQKDSRKWPKAKNKLQTGT
jgi:hypothetical protein